MSTESVNQNSRNIDKKSTAEILQIINNEDKTVALAVEKVLPELAKVIDCAYECLKNNGRIFYIGAGTSGRLAIQDAAECTVTYGVPEGTVNAIMAGGKDAVFKPKENVEDNFSDGENQIKINNIGKDDIVIGVSASGNADFVCGALNCAKNSGAKTVALICNEKGKMCNYADFSICIVTGAEVISGSTRMKAGTAQKMTLNMISTAVMIKLGKVTDNFMTWMTPTNQKLIERAKFIVSQICETSKETATLYLEKNNYNIKSAIKNYMEEN